MQLSATIQQRVHDFLAGNPDEAVLRWIFRSVVTVTIIVLAADLAGMNGWIGHDGSGGRSKARYAFAGPPGHGAVNSGPARPGRRQAADAAAASRWRDGQADDLRTGGRRQTDGDRHHHAGDFRSVRRRSRQAWRLYQDRGAEFTRRVGDRRAGDGPAHSRTEFRDRDRAREILRLILSAAVRRRIGAPRRRQGGSRRASGGGGRGSKRRCRATR